MICCNHDCRQGRDCPVLNARAEQRCQRLKKAFSDFGQTRRHSVIESLTNVAIGYGVAVASQLAIFPLFGIHIPLGDNLLIGLWFTAISIVRSYALRRLFNRLTQEINR